MAQERKLVFGALVETEDLPTAIANIMAAGRLIGFDFEVSASDLLRISPGSCLLPNGIIILENTNKELLVNNTSFAADYTVVYQLEDSSVLGGSPAILRILPGTLAQRAFTDATVLGWIRYPGGSIPLSVSHFIQPTPVRVESKSGALSQVFKVPFQDALRPPGEMPGSTVVKAVRQANLSSVFSTTLSYGGISTRIRGSTITTDSTAIIGNISNYDTFAVQRVQTFTGNTATGSNVLVGVANVARIVNGQGVFGAGIPAGASVISVAGNNVTITALASATASAVSLSFTDRLFTYDTRPLMQGTVSGGVPTPMVRSTLPPDRFVLASSDTLRVINAITMVPTAAAGEINVVAESPATSGTWQESMPLYSGEPTIKISNAGPSTQLYTLRLPFVVTGEGQPRKLITRLNVDFNTIVTFTIRVDGQVVTLTPLSGTVANTGGLATREFTIPFISGVDWQPGHLAQIEVSINAQPGGSAAFAHVSLSAERVPFLIFT